VFDNWRGGRPRGINPREAVHFFITGKGFGVNTSRWAVAALALVLGGSVVLSAEEPKAAPADAAPAAANESATEAAPEGATDAAPKAADAAPKAADEPAAGAAAAGEARAGATQQPAARKVRLTQPWKNMTSLTDEQKAQIAAVHRKAVQEIKQIEQRERAEIMALLSDSQKAELQAITDKAAAERKARKPAAGGKKQAGEADAGDQAERAG
jgi:hypothetical protein